MVVEFMGWFKLEPTGKVDGEIVNNLGLSNLRSPWMSRKTYILRLSSRKQGSTLKFENQLEGGDELNVSVVGEEGFQVKEVGVRIVYKEEQEEKSIQIHSTIEAAAAAQQTILYGNVVPGTASARPARLNFYRLGKPHDSNWSENLGEKARAPTMSHQTRTREKQKSKVSSMASQSSGYVGQNTMRYCCCSVRSSLRTSWTPTNTGRRFWGCGSFEIENIDTCGYFEWVDPPLCPQAQELLHILSQKLKHLEREVVVRRGREIFYRRALIATWMAVLCVFTWKFAGWV
ncbi:uncharacterized protein LOC130786363 [Actinidia eriantha]|uniref:uncharacterized protein LOC130786363 n=1 Tax=Actinidia eriantha TaxID=165200 RepID=UPI002591096F|nr:uncharacterized protein LOC130786363 [Actinidia eriantha]